MPPSNYDSITGAGELLQGLVVGIDHIGVCVRDIDDSGKAWATLLGHPVVDREDVEPQKTTAAFLRVGGADAASVELVCPMPGNVGLDKFLDKRGDALHHVAFAVTDIEKALSILADAGVRLIDEAPRAGAGGHLVAFLHPKSMGGTLVELVQRSH
jgi:methylmalonyl-CoA/ethylmalonyl-CoA epimerase